jgi:hypothetical protein
MSGWIWLGIVLLLIAAFLAIRLRVAAAYNEDGVRITARFGRITVFRYPGKQGAKPKEKKPKNKEPKKPKKTENEETKKGGKLPPVRDLLSIIGDVLGKLKRKLRVDELTLWYCSASPDPFSTAIAFGGVSAGAGLLLAPLERTFRIRKRDIRTAVSFTDTEPTVILKLSLSLSVFAVFSIAACAGIRFLRMRRKKSK